MQIYRISSRRQLGRSGPPAWTFGRQLTPHYKTPAYYEILQRASDLDCFF